MDQGLESRAAQLFQKGQYQEALQVYTKCINGLVNSRRVDLKVNLLFNRSACYLKLKNFKKVVEDCKNILFLDPTNSKAKGRQIKALCSLGNFPAAQHLANEWIESEPGNEYARKELERLHIIAKALQDGEDDNVLEESRVPGDRSREEFRPLPMPSKTITPGLTYSNILAQNLPASTASNPMQDTTKSSYSFNTLGSNFNIQTSSAITRPKTTNQTNSLDNTDSVSAFFQNFLSLSHPKTTNEPVLGLAQAEDFNLSFPPKSPTVPPAVNYPLVCHTCKRCAAKFNTEEQLNLHAILCDSHANRSQLSNGNHSNVNLIIPEDSAIINVKTSGGKLDLEPFSIEDKEVAEAITNSGRSLAGSGKALSIEQAQKEISSLAQKLKKHDEGRGDNKWVYRPPPRGFTSQDYSLCPRYMDHGICRFGDSCPQAHSTDELNEWKDRFEERKRQKSSSENVTSYAEKLLKKWMTAENPALVMTDNIDGVNIHINSELEVHMSTKKATHSWLFTASGKVCLKRAVLLDDANRKYFHVASVTIGPKKNQKIQSVDDQCQEWVNPNTTDSNKLMSNEKVYRIKVVFNTDIYGTFRQSIVFDFGTEPVLARELCVDSTPLCDLSKLEEDLKLSERGRWDLTKKNVITYEPSPHCMDKSEENLLKRYPLPRASSIRNNAALLDDELTKDNYKARMHSLLNLEEMAQFSAIAKYNIKTPLQIVSRFQLMPSSNNSAAQFAQGGEMFARMKLNWDISEDTSHGRLILQNSNTVYIAPCDMSQSEDAEPHTVYEALVVEKGKNFIFLRLSAKTVKDLKLEPDNDFNAQVQFHLNRMPICEMHQAVDRLSNLGIIYPSLSKQPNIPWTPGRQWPDKLDMRLNAKQKEAVMAITCGLNLVLPPELIVGPYGTGKTFTLAQTAKAVLRQDPNSRILICTHSNSAADLYIKDYLHPYVEDGHPEARPLRVVYRLRWVQTVHQLVLQYCLTSVEPGRGTVFTIPTKEDLDKHHIVVTTLSTSGSLHDVGLPPGYFTHILIDEAAQAMECEAIIPLSLASDKTRVVLAGDHMQLSPEVHSEFAKDRKLHVSLLERLYDLYPSNFPCKVMLVENYRSHKAIIDYTSELFYDKKLIASGQQPAHSSYYPLSFFTARGEDTQHQNSTAYYNNAEVYEIVERISDLEKNWPASWGTMDENGIGVVAPYADQVVRIRSELRKRKLFNISVERVLNVQGKQFRVIFLSTVRTRHTCSSDTAIEEMMDYGFLSNIKLLNTAITRAQSLVAVVGDPVSLCSIGKCRKLWERFLEICHEHHSLNGITWTHLRAQLDGVELKKTYVLNPNAPEFIPNRLRHTSYAPPEPVSYGKFGYTFAPPTMPPNWQPRHPHGWYSHNPYAQMQFLPRPQMMHHHHQPHYGPRGSFVQPHHTRPHSNPLTIKTQRHKPDVTSHNSPSNHSNSSSVTSAGASPKCSGSVVQLSSSPHVQHAQMSPGRHIATSPSAAEHHPQIGHPVYAHNPHVGAIPRVGYPNPPPPPHMPYLRYPIYQTPAPWMVPPIMLHHPHQMIPPRLPITTSIPPPHHPPPPLSQPPPATQKPDQATTANTTVDKLPKTQPAIQFLPNSINTEQDVVDKTRTGDQSWLRNMHLQQELFNFILHTEGKNAADSFLKVPPEESENSGAHSFSPIMQFRYSNEGSRTSPYATSHMPYSQRVNKGDRPSPVNDSEDTTQQPPPTEKKTKSDPTCPWDMPDPVISTTTKAKTNGTTAQTNGFDGLLKLNGTGDHVADPFDSSAATFEAFHKAELETQEEEPESRPLPLYLRGSVGTSRPPPPVGSSLVPPVTTSSTSSSQMSYAHVLRSQVTPPADLQPPSDEPPKSDSPEDPLELLKNLKIKASPGMQAFYEYFS